MQLILDLVLAAYDCFLLLPILLRSTDGEWGICGQQQNRLPSFIYTCIAPSEKKGKEMYVNSYHGDW
jgi:hypothetical protein